MYIISGRIQLQRLRKDVRESERGVEAAMVGHRLLYKWHR